MSAASQEKTWFDSGDKVIYQYTHHLNSKSTTEIVKKGLFVREVKRKKRFLADWEADPRCVVQLEGNKNPSIVRRSQLYPVDYNVI